MKDSEPVIIDGRPSRGQARRRHLAHLAAVALLAALGAAACRAALSTTAPPAGREAAQPRASDAPAAADRAAADRAAADLGAAATAGAAATVEAVAALGDDAAVIEVEDALALPSPSLVATAPPPTAAAAPSAMPSMTTPGDAAVPPPPGAVPVAVAASGRVSLPGAVHVYQKWNNCAPSSAVMALSVFGIARDQLAAAAELKPDGKDTNVGPEELAVYLRAQGLRSRVVYGADAATVRLLVTAGVPAIVEQWVAVEGRGEMGHYRVITGFQAGAMLAQDSYYGPNRAIDDAAFEAEWRPFGRAMVLVYRPDQEASVAAALGPLADEAAMLRAALSRQEAEDASIGDAWAHLALAEARARLGDWAGAAEAGDRAMAKGLPFRALWYQFGYYRALHALGRFQNLLDLCDRTLAPMKGEQLEESHYWRGMALRGLGREAEAVEAFRAALRFNPRLAEARAALGA